MLTRCFDTYGISWDFSVYKFLCIFSVNISWSQFNTCYWFIDASVRKKRKKHGGSGRKLFTEGWIEFKDKRIANAVALSLNNTPVGNNVEFIINWFTLGIHMICSARSWATRAKIRDGTWKRHAYTIFLAVKFVGKTYFILNENPFLMSDRSTGEMKQLTVADNWFDLTNWFLDFFDCTNTK